jgi:DNA-binding MarR family transcriptional regulator
MPSRPKTTKPGVERPDERGPRGLAQRRLLRQLTAPRRPRTPAATTAAATHPTTGRPGALSGALGIHRSAVVALVDDLEHRGLAERRRDPDDRRAYALYLTSSGRELLAELDSAADEDEAELLTALDASERSQLISLLQRVAESQGLTAGVHPNLELREGDDHTAQNDVKTRPAHTRRTSR